MKVYICSACGWIRLVSRRKDVECHKCGQTQMRLTNIDLNKYTNMTEEERQGYSEAWLYIHNRQKG